MRFKLEFERMVCMLPEAFLNRMKQQLGDEYEDYLAKPSRKTATEFLARAIEDNIASLMNSKTYADVCDISCVSK